MDPSSIRQIVILLILLLLSAFFSSAETALTTVNKHRMRALANQGNKKAARVLALIEKPEKMLSAILIGNNIVNLSASSLTTTLAMSLASQAGLGKNTSTFVGLATGILTFLILISIENVIIKIISLNPYKKKIRINPSGNYPDLEVANSLHLCWLRFRSVPFNL